MRVALSLAFASSLIAGCVAGDPVSSAEGAISYGAIDTTHTAVVALLAPAGGGGYSACSGTIVQLRSGVAYVLTAAHCCNTAAPTIVVMGNDYSGGEAAVAGGPVTPPAFAVIAGSVAYDPSYDMMSHDFCMLRFAAPAGTAVIPVASPGTDMLALGTPIEHVGFGITDTNAINSTRRHGSDTLDDALGALTLTCSQGGATHTPGTCEGDSGGPALVPAGAAQSAQMVVGVTSYGSSSSCAGGTYSVSSRVSSATGPGGFITNYLNDVVAPRDCGACTASAQTGPCMTQAHACGSDTNCTTLNSCKDACATAACIAGCESAAGATANTELDALVECICTSACPTECASECPSSAADAGTTTDAETTMDAGLRLDASSAVDAAGAPDAGRAPAVDAGSSGDGGAALDASRELVTDGGAPAPASTQCGCTAAGTGGSHSASGVSLGAVVVIAFATKRRARGRSRLPV